MPWCLCEIPGIQIFMSERGGNPVSICLQKWDGGTEVSDNLPKRCQHFQLPDRSVCLCQSKQKDGSAIRTEFKAKQRTNYPFPDQDSCSSFQICDICDIPCKPLWEQWWSALCGWPALLKYQKFGTRKVSHSKQNLQTVKIPDTPQNYSAFSVHWKGDCFT